MATTYAKSLRELAAKTGKKHNRLIYFRDRGAPVKREKNGYPIEPLLDWIKDNVRQNVNGHKGPEGEGYALALLKAQAAERAAKAILAELKAEVEQGKYVPLEEIKERDLSRIAAVRRGLLSLPKGIAHLLSGLSPPEIEALLTRKVRELLEKFSRM